MKPRQKTPDQVLGDLMPRRALRFDGSQSEPTNRRERGEGNMKTRFCEWGKVHDFRATAVGDHPVLRDINRVAGGN